MVHFLSHVHTIMLQTHCKVTYDNSFLELKVSSFYKSLFVRDFTRYLHLLYISLM